MRIGVFQDLHANFPALKKAVEVFDTYHCDTIIHVGDLISIGPFPKETMDFAMSIPNMEFVMGNHDYWYGNGLPNVIPEWMSDEEVAHQKWTHQEIGPEYISKVSQWPFEINKRFGEFQITFQHYGLNEKKNWFRGFIKEPEAEDLDQWFDPIFDFAFYGHNHDARDIRGRARYVNLGSAGCYSKAVVRLGILEEKDGQLVLQKIEEGYDDGNLFQAYDVKQVPAREFILSNFISRD